MNSRAREFLGRARLEAERVEKAEAFALDALESFLDSFDGEITKALDRLKGKTDPASVRARLAILLRAQRVDEAASSVRGLNLHERWCDLATAAFMAVGDIRSAAKTVEWAAEFSDPALRERCLLSGAEAAYVYAFRERKSGVPLRVKMITEQELADLGRVDHFLRPLIDAIRSRVRIRSSFEARAVKLAFRVYYLMEKKEVVEGLSPLLSQERPLPLEIAWMTLERVITPPRDVVETLRADYPVSFEPRLMAVLIEAEVLGRSIEAFEQGKALISLASTNAEREQLCFVLLDISQTLDRDLKGDLENLIDTLVRPGTRAFDWAKASLALRAENAAAAEEGLARSADETHPLWLQMKAKLLSLKGQNDEAIVVLKRAAEMIALPTLYRTIVELASQQSNVGELRSALTELLQIDPGDTKARMQLASTLMQSGDYTQAAEHFHLLTSKHPQNATFHVNEAVCLARTHALEESLRAYEKACALPDPPFEAIGGRVNLLRVLGRSKDAFDSLADFKKRYWDDENFVLCYMHTAHAAEEERLAHEAFVQLQILQASGKASDDVMQAVTMDQLVEMMREANERNEGFCNDLLLSKTSWLMVDIGARQGAYWGWYSRTQPLEWVGEGRLNRAQFAIYSTNGFYPRKDDSGDVRLMPLECPGPQTEIVADLSALITLDRAHLLGKALEFFGKILIPSAYMSYAFGEANSLVPHQPSRKLAAEKIRNAIGAHRITVTPRIPEIPLVHEHNREETALGHDLYRLRDVAAGLKGHVTDAQLHSLEGISHRAARTDAEHAALPPGGQVHFAISTLESLATLGLLDAVLSVYTVLTSIEDERELNQELLSHQACEQVRDWQSDLWQKIRGDSRFVQINHEPQLGEPPDHREHLGVALEAIALAQQTGKPLLVDDRLIQTVYLNEHKGAVPAFGSDALLSHMLEHGVLKPDEAAERFVQLARWRYRFCVPPVVVLKVLASKYKAKLPGKELLELARYVHDCMADAGLFAGPEATNPPVPLAVHLYLAWIGVVAEFMVEVWHDESFEEEQAVRLTEWAITELIPVVPKNLPLQIQASAASALGRTLLGRAMIHASTTGEIKRARNAIHAIAEAMKLDERSYREIVVGVINAASLE